MDQVARAVAHELGHNLGLGHDTPGCGCEDCVMAAAALGAGRATWSRCSMGELQESRARGLLVCLGPWPPVQFGGPLCGNGVVEEGEQCDCLGPPCDCCRACKLRPGAQCGGGPCCDLQGGCTLRRPGALCRAARGACDLLELCTGTSAECPKDLHRENGEECGGTGLCYKGACARREASCRLLFGPKALPGPPGCYQDNLQGQEGGHCGIRRTGAPRACRAQDQECGLLHCSLLEPPVLHYGLGGLATVTQGSRCSAAVLGLNRGGPDPGMVPEGAPCGFRTWCRAMRCVPRPLTRGPPVPCSCSLPFCCPFLWTGSLLLLLLSLLSLLIARKRLRSSRDYAPLREPVTHISAQPEGPGSASWPTKSCPVPREFVL